MKIKEIAYKTGKGALGGVIAISGGLFVAGFPMDEQAWKMVCGSVLSAAFHGGANVLKQFFGKK